MKIKNIFATMFLLSIFRVTFLKEIIIFDIGLTSYVNYLITFLTIFIIIYIGKFRYNKVMTLMIILLIIDFLLNHVSIYAFLIRMSFVLSGYLFFSFYSNKESYFSQWPIKVTIIIYLLEMSILYYMQIPGLDTYLHGWIYNGNELGIAKAQLATLLVITIIYLLVHHNYYILMTVLLISWPLLLIARASISACFALCFFHVIALKFNSIKTGLLSIFVILSSLVSYSVYLGSFDRMHSYVLAINVLKNDISGLGLRNYYNYTTNNIEQLKFELAKYLKHDDMFFVGAESMYADLIATRGIFGIIIILAYLIVFITGVQKYKFLEPMEQFIILFWGYLFFVGIGSDHTHIDTLFYLSLGCACAVSYRSKKLIS